MSDYPMLISNKLHSFRNFLLQVYDYNHSCVQKHSVHFGNEYDLKNQIRQFLLVGYYFLQEDYSEIYP